MNEVNTQGGASRSDKPGRKAFTCPRGFRLRFAKRMNAWRRWWTLALGLGAVWVALTLNATTGTALRFDGTNDVVSVAGFGNVVPTNEVTIEFWQRVDRVKSQAPFILSPDQGPNRFLASTPYGDSRVYLDYGNYTNRGRLSYMPSMALSGSWQHFAFAVSVSGGFMRIYRNGVLEASTNTTSFYTRIDSS
jgi:hypothetical protein